MAYDLVARLKLVDRLSQPIKRAINSMRGMRSETDATTRAVNESNKATNLWRDSHGRLRDEMGRFASAGRQYSGTFDRIGGSIAGLQGNIGGLRSSLIGLSGAYAAVEGGKSLFDATIKAAAHTEMEQAVISALFNNTKKADDWFNYVEKRAKDSALFSMDDFLKASKAYIPMTKDISQLKQLTALTERLAASNPMQGMEGASFSIREAMSGDLVSLNERFNLPKQWTKELKGKSGQDFINTMDKLLSRMGFTEKFLGDISETGLAKYNQLAEKVRLAFKDMGKAGLEQSKPILDRISAMMDEGKFSGIQSFGSDLIVSAMEATEKAVVSLDKFITRLQSDEEWKKASIGDKLIRLTEEGMDALNNWLENDGSEKIAQATSAITKTAIGIGVSIGSGMLEGLVQYMKDEPLSGAIVAAILALKIGGGATLAGAALGASGPLAAAARGLGWGLAALVLGGLTAALIAGISDAVNDALDKAKLEREKFGGLGDTPTTNTFFQLEEKPDDQPLYTGNTISAHTPSTWQSIKDFFTNPLSNYNGIDYVPYDGYKAVLHKGEKVVPAMEARRSNNGTPIVINVNGLTVREEADVNRIGAEIVRRLELAGGMMS